jgi:hypothetical protein
MKVLVTAPYVGEIGWELMAWQGRVRRRFVDGGFDHLVVLGSARKDAFYGDMPLDYRTADLSALPGAAYEDRRYDRERDCPIDASEIRAHVEPLVTAATTEFEADGRPVEVLWPGYDGSHVPCDDRHQLFVEYRRPHPAPKPAPWVVLVQRTRAFGSTNYSADQWAELADRLRDHGVHTTVFPCDSTGAIEALSNCDLAVGQSTGGLHLAALCGCPRLVWSLERYLWSPWEITNRQRYETMWNPLGAPTRVFELDRPPTPVEATDQIISALAAIGRRTGSRTRRQAARWAWLARHWMMEHVITTRAYARWPWMVQRWVRYRLI